MAVSALLAGGVALDGAAQSFPPVVELGSLSVGEGFRIDGESVGDRSGISVSAAGDINGDGIDDLIVGAYGADPNGGLSGSSYVVFGRDTATAGAFPVSLNLGDLDGSDGFRIDGAAEGDQSGYSVSAAGDINGDGIDDLIVGAPLADPNGAYSGSAYVIFGRDTATAGTFPASLNLAVLFGSDGFRVDGAAEGDRAGNSVSAAGDINGDGIDDLIVGAYGADPNGDLSGSSYVVFGRDTATAGAFPASVNLGGLDGSDGFRLDGESVGDVSGRSVSAAGDINGDGIDDLIVGAPGSILSGDDSGSSYVVFGRDTATAGAFPAVLNLGDLDGSNGFRLDGEAANDRAGISVSAAGDINGDGIDDLIVGANRADPNGNASGSSYVVFGRNTAMAGGFPDMLPLSALDGAIGFRIDGEAAEDNSGRSVSAAGDINGDGIDDLIVGAFGADPDGVNSGSSYVVFGRNTAVAGAFPATLPLSALDGAIGFRIDATKGIRNPDTAAGFRSGFSVSAAGDINGDGIDDLLIGAYRADHNGDDSGSSYVVFGGITGPGEVPTAVSLAPDPLEFGDVALGDSSTEMLIVESTGDGTLAPGTIAIEGVNAADFTIDVNGCAGAQLAKGEFCGIDIEFAPTAPGLRRAMLKLESNAPSSPDFAELRGSNDVVFADGYESD